MGKMLLPGTVLTQAGEELGLSSLDLSQAEDPEAKKHLALYRLLAENVRSQDAVLYGDLGVNSTFVKNEGNVFGLTRVKKGSPGYVLVINLGDTEQTVDLSGEPNIPEAVRVLEREQTMAISPLGSTGTEEVRKFASNSVTLTAGQAKIFNFVPKIKE